MDRRTFVSSTASASAATLLGALPALGAAGANEKIVIATMGMGGRGTRLASEFEAINRVEVKAVYDVDRARAEIAAIAVGKVNGRRIEHGQDFRRALDDKSIDAIVIATSNHWHAPAAIMAAAAGKHVYVEKPCSHNPREGELMVKAARVHRRVIQHGTQRRSMPGIREGAERLRAGAIGRIYYAKCYLRGGRSTIGNGRLMPPPEYLDYDLWQGPAPRRPYLDNRIHYNWHWFWHWGNGELGNNGVHRIDIARAVLDVDYPVQVVASGERYHFPDDDQETPDTMDAVFKFADGKSIAWEAMSCNRQFPGDKAEMWFYGTEGSAAFASGGYRLFDPDGKEVDSGRGRGGEQDHLDNFIAAIRDGVPLNAEIEEGHKSALLCHLGNIAYRTGRTLTCNPTDGTIVGDTEAMKLWSREYETGWEPVV